MESLIRAVKAAALARQKENQYQLGKQRAEPALGALRKMTFPILLRHEHLSHPTPLLKSWGGWGKAGQGELLICPLPSIFAEILCSENTNVLLTSWWPITVLFFLSPVPSA